MPCRSPADTTGRWRSNGPAYPCPARLRPGTGRHGVAVPCARQAQGWRYAAKRLWPSRDRTRASHGLGLTPAQTRQIANPGQTRGRTKVTEYPIMPEVAGNAVPRAKLKPGWQGLPDALIVCPAQECPAARSSRTSYWIVCRDRPAAPVRDPLLQLDLGAFGLQLGLAGLGVFLVHPLPGSRRAHSPPPTWPLSGPDP